MWIKTERQTARPISLSELADLLPECVFIVNQEKPRDPGCRCPRSQWEELETLCWLHDHEDTELLSY